jgi:hypothetical protein
MRHREFGLITVGQPHPRSLDGEGAEFTWCADWLELTMTFRDPSRSEQQAVEAGVFEVALNVVEQIPFLCFRIFQVNNVHSADHSKPATWRCRGKSARFIWYRFTQIDCPILIMLFRTQTFVYRLPPF